MQLDWSTPNSRNSKIETEVKKLLAPVPELKGIISSCGTALM